MRKTMIAALLFVPMVVIATVDCGEKSGNDGTHAAVLQTLNDRYRYN